MRVTWGLERAEFNPRTITTLGSYDGLHLGHRKILDRLIERKRELGLERSLVLTFHPHPQEVLRKNDTTIQLLTTIEERIELLQATGVDEVVIIEFTKEFAGTSYIDFFTNTLVKALGTQALTVGFNHAFGKNREGDAEHLKTLAPQLGVSIEEIGPLELKGVGISSTRIRQALLRGDLALANAFLGRPYSFQGTVGSGEQVGKLLGYPTANLDVADNKVLPGDGIYAVTCEHAGNRYQAALSIGTKPTFTTSHKRYVEVFIFDFDKDIYEESLKIVCHEYLREQIAFASASDLQLQIEKDVARCREVLNAKG